MNKKDILDKIKSLEGLSNEERAYLVNLVNTKKKYGLVWEDKPEEVEEQLRTKLPILKEVKERAIINDTETEKHPNHILIEGDNLHALTALTFTHENKIDLIYIDPPYNTGENDFRYHDAFKDEPEFIDKEHPFRHSTWLSFMAKRLEIAKKLLSETGVLVCHIDENEQDNLSVLLREIFGENNNLGTIVWNKKNPKGDAKGVANMHEYLLCYSLNKSMFLSLEDTLQRNKPNADAIIKRAQKLFNKIGKTEIPEDAKDLLKRFNVPKSINSHFKITYDLETITKEFKVWLDKSDFSKGEKMYKYIDNDGQAYRGVSMAWPNKKQAPDDYFVPLKHPIDKIDCPIPERGWRNPTSTMNKLLGDKDYVTNPDGSILKGEILFGKNSQKQPERKYELRNNLKENTPSIYEFGGSDDSFFKSIGIDFPYAKPLGVAKYLISSIHPNPNIVLDFFAGTGPALHGVMSNNLELGLNTQSILITNNEDGIADDCYLRNKKVIHGYEVVKGDKKELIQGLTNNNLRYYQCDFVEREPSLDNKRQLTQLATELLCIKEDCYQEVTSTLNSEVWNKLFTNGQGQYVYVVYDDLYIEEAVESLTALVAQEAPESKIKVYVFANGQYAYAEEFEDIAENITLAALPDAIYKAYQNVLPKENKKFVPVLEEDIDVEPEMDFE